MSSEWMDFYHLRGCCTQYGAWFPRAGHVDMGRTIQVDLFWQHPRAYTLYPVSRMHHSLICSLLFSLVVSQVPSIS